MMRSTATAEIAEEAEFPPSIWLRRSLGPFLGSLEV